MTGSPQKRRPRWRATAPGPDGTYRKYSTFDITYS